MERRMEEGRERIRAAVGPLLARLGDLLGPGDSGGDGPACESWEDAESAYLETRLPGLGSGEIDISVVGDRVFVRVAGDRPD